MTTILSTGKLVPLIEDLSRSITEIASILKDAQEEAPAAETVSENKPKSTQKLKASNPDSSATSCGDIKSVTIEQVRAVLAEKSQAGLTLKVKDLLTSFGSIKLSGIDPARYAELMEAAKALQ